MFLPRPPDARSSNWLLAALPEDEHTRLAPDLEGVELEIKQIMFDYDQPITHVYFPESCVGSILSVMSDGTAVETATVGREGLVGLPVFLGADRTPAQAFCQVPGEAIRMTATAFRRAAALGGPLAAMINRYTQALFTLVAQSSACNRLHPVQQRCARWLLMTQDRVNRKSFPLTQQFLSQMLGVRRATVTEAAGALQDGGCIDYSYGTVKVTNRRGLEEASCECYSIIRRELERLLNPGKSPAVEPGKGFSENGKTTVGDGAPPSDGD
jgi:CRP-like cAMP-binding protein